MKVTINSKRQIRLQNILFVLLFVLVIGLLAWLSQRYQYQADWTVNSRNTLSQASVAVLEQMPEPISVSVFTVDSGVMRQHADDLLGRYQRYKKTFEFEFINPDMEPDRVRRLGIKIDGALLLEYEGRSEKITTLSEQAITNALQRLSRASEPWIVFVEGHGERSPFGKANHDLQVWAQQLEAKGFQLHGLNLATAALVPDNARILVVAGPQVAFLPGEVVLIEDYIRRGGNLLWLADPDGIFGLEPLAEQLGLRFEPGVIVDPTAQMFAIDDPTFAIVGDYGLHPVVDGFDVLTVFPRAAGVTVEPQGQWQSDSFLFTTERSWSETGVLAGEISFDELAEVAGPLSLAVAVTRRLDNDVADDETEPKQQRILVVGDGDFLSNAYLGNGGNLDLGMNMVNWLSRDDQLIAVPTKVTLDRSLNLSRTASMVIGFGFLIFLPATLLLSGLGIWLKRRQA